MSGRTILPTAHCFDDAIELLEYLANENPAFVAEQRDLWLVHGLCQTLDDQQYAHGWVELADECIEAGLLDGRRLFYPVARERYYTARRVVQATAYNMKSVVYENERTNHYGPWQEDYRALCRTDGRVIVVGRVNGLFSGDTIAIDIDYARRR